MYPDISANTIFWYINLTLPKILVCFKADVSCGVKMIYLNIFLLLGLSSFVLSNGKCNYSMLNIKPCHLTRRLLLISAKINISKLCFFVQHKIAKNPMNLLMEKKQPSPIYIKGDNGALLSVCRDGDTTCMILPATLSSRPKQDNDKH